MEKTLTQTNRIKEHAGRIKLIAMFFVVLGFMVLTLLLTTA